MPGGDDRDVAFLLEQDSSTPRKRNPLLIPVVILSVAVVGLAIACGILASDSSSTTTTAPATSPSASPLPPVSPSAGPSPTGASSILHISDLHYDPLYVSTQTCASFCRTAKQVATSFVCGAKNTAPAKVAATYGRRGCDASKELIDSAIAAMVAANPNPLVVIITGDIAAHDLCGNSSVGFGQCVSEVGQDRATQQAAMQYVATALRAAYPTTPILNLLGNNDTPMHYVTPLGPNGAPFLEAWEDTWGPGVRCDGCGLTDYEANMTTFADGGFYVARRGGVRFLILNTLLVYFRLPTYDLTPWGGMDAQNAAAAAQIAWLKDQLAAAAAANETVVLASHVAPGVDPFDNDDNLLSAGQTELFEALLPHAGIVSAFLAGHYHTDLFTMMRLAGAADPSPASTIPVLAMSSVTPVYQGNPSFRSYQLTGGRLSDFTQWWLDLPAANAGRPQWAPYYSFNAEYGTELADNAYLLHLSDSFITNSTLYRRFVTNRLTQFAPFQVRHACLTMSSTSTEVAACMAANDASERHSTCDPPS